MTIPPFPSQDLAKLVLGYLAEEQLMTAYDEFLQTSPYLDALRNEYDRIFMTSLKFILAEYRAVRIFVENCKPLLLRQKLVQCSNLFEVVKLLVNYTDITKLQSQDVTNANISVTKQNISRQNLCEVCCSVGSTSCVCRSKQYRNSLHSATDVETSSLQISVKTTALEDLPGNYGTSRKKHVRVLEKTSVSESGLSINQTSNHPSASSYVQNYNKQDDQTNANLNASLHHSNIVKPADSLERRENGDKIEEFNNILQKVCNNKTSNAHTSNKSNEVPQFQSSESRGSNASFQDFSAGVNGPDKQNPVPDSSTSDNSNTQVLVKDNSSATNKTYSGLSKNQNEQAILPSNNHKSSRIKTSDHRIKIISDVKVDHPFPTVNNATSTPLLQSIVINGTPAYKQKLPIASKNYTKDQIMAMPTIIVVPTSAPPQKYVQTQPVNSNKKKKVKTKTVPSAKLLGPLVIDVSSSPVTIDNSDKVKQDSEVNINLQKPHVESGLIKTVDFPKNASVPKDMSGSTYINTPEVVPPSRKSSSTPRRNSHIRVLDFNTPRRLLLESSEKIPEETESQSVEIVVTKGSNMVEPTSSNCENNIIDISTVTVHKLESCHISNIQESSNIKAINNKKSNWDADLRALVVANESSTKEVKKSRIRNIKKKSHKGENLQKYNKESNDKLDAKKSESKRKKSPKGKKSKRRKLEEEEEQYDKNIKNNEPKPTLKPIFSIVAADSRNLQGTLQPVEVQNKNNSESNNETPEEERISLQNEIGVKLNISELLETPYKQALYDIQMETPKFLGTMLTDEPISDVKIMNIPTPRFFDTPKPVQATPSYATRGTDYSSGGSYYKPDEQDYLKIPELECPVTSSKEAPNKVLSKVNKNDSKVSSRPVRKCTKNISYKLNRSKVKDTEDDIEVASNYSDSSMSSSLDNSKENLKTPKTPKVKSKSETKKRCLVGKKVKTPIKRDRSSSFMKIKPRRPTPIKANNKIYRGKAIALQKKSPSTQLKQRVFGKDKSIQKSIIVTSAINKSRRKSSTPRKLHCTKQFNSESSVSPEMNVPNVKMNINLDRKLATHDSDTEQITLRWSDDGSQDAKIRLSECEEISKIKEYIASSKQSKPDYSCGKGTLQVDLIKRGFDAETAKIIERDLLDAPMDIEQKHMNVQMLQTIESPVENVKASNELATNEPEMLQDAEDDIELSVYECNEECKNYMTYISETIDTPSVSSPVRLKEAWNMEVCIDDGLSIRLRTTNFNLLYDQMPQNIEAGYSFKETEAAVSSISDIDNLFTPRKDRRAQCYDIFDSTLTSLDTPLKLNSPKERIETREIEIVVEEEREECIDNKDLKKRKQLQDSNNSEQSLVATKKTKSEPQYLFNSTNIQNIDIESVLKKLHGP